MTERPDLRVVSSQTHRDAVERGLAAYDDLHAAHEEAITRADSFERSMVITNAENERLRRELKSVKAQRDHFLKAFTALKAQLSSYVQFAQAGAKMLSDAMAMAEVQMYEPPAPRPTGQQAVPGAARMPSIVGKGPAS